MSAKSLSKYALIKNTNTYVVNKILYLKQNKNIIKKILKKRIFWVNNKNHIFWLSPWWVYGFNPGQLHGLSRFRFHIYSVSMRFAWKGISKMRSFLIVDGNMMAYLSDARPNNTIYSMEGIRVQYCTSACIRFQRNYSHTFFNKLLNVWL